MTPPATARSRIAAWLVHALTASGVVFGFAALEAASRADAPATFGWLAVALLIDGIDGPLARACDVTRFAPRIDGAALDLVVDYFTYVVVPAVYLHAAGAFPPGLAFACAALILTSSLYTFARRDMKAESADFRGFPAVWNLVAAAFVVTATPPWAAAAVTALCAALTFAPVKAVHPIRVTALRPLTLAMSALWLVTTGLLIALPHASWAGAAMIGWWIATIYMLVLCGARSLIQPRQ